MGPSVGCKARALYITICMVYLCGKVRLIILITRDGR